MSRLLHSRRRSGAVPVVAASLALAAIVIAVLFANTATTHPEPAIPTAAKHFVAIPSDGSREAALRTVVIAGPGERLPFMSATGSVLMASLERGQLPAGAVRATVLTDANCQPDQDGVSHCRNELAIGATTLVVRHHHKMSEVPCLTPGETVNILSLEQYRKL
jgi:hypothetical protein